MRLTIEKLVYGGSGLARTGEGIVFVPRTAPGDVVEVSSVQRKADYAIARAWTLLEPSPDRQVPACPNYDTAGCCHWEHIRYSKQLEIKEQVLRETLRRVGKIAWEDRIGIAASPERNYRIRATFHIAGSKLGFVREGSHVVVPVPACISLAPELNDFIPQANALLASPEMQATREVRAVAGGTVAASFIPQDGKVHVRQFGTEPPQLQVQGLTWNLHPEAFFQSNRYLLDTFVGEVVSQAIENDGAAALHILDLYCGSGFFSLPLARHATEVLGVESHKGALRQARFNARRNSVWNVTFVEGDVGATLKNAEVKPDVVLLNPPRAGCGKKAAGRIAAIGAPRLVYVSCNPSTFAREAAIFAAAGYALTRLTLIDQFPNTYHIETVATFQRR